MFVYFVVMNLITFFLFAVDKWKAVHDRWRIRESVLLGFSLAGGALGGYLAMQIFRHKIRKPRFRIGVPLMLVVQVVFLIYSSIG